MAASGRALAASARRGGFCPLVVDFFADQDTIAIAHSHRRLNSGLLTGMEPDAVLEALQALAPGAQGAARAPGVVCGTGFEDRPALLARIAERWELLGNPPQVVARVKDPVCLAALCRDCGIPHPEISLQEPADANGWLMKRRGGAGGRHVQEKFGADRVEGSYFQRRIAGTPVSAAVLGASTPHGHRAIVLGFSAQWPAPTLHQPFRYGGAVTPAALMPQTADALDQAVRRLTEAVPLVGLNSVDFLVEGADFWLLDVNPRPGATLDIFEPEGGSLFALHVAACRGALPARLSAREGAKAAAAKAAAIVYAGHDIAFVPACPWPDWTADRPRPGTSITAGDPLCTVMAAAVTPVQAKRLVERRAETILSWMCERAA